MVQGLWWVSLLAARGDGHGRPRGADRRGPVQRRHPAVHHRAAAGDGGRRRRARVSRDVAPGDRRLRLDNISGRRTGRRRGRSGPGPTSSRKRWRSSLGSIGAPSMRVRWASGRGERGRDCLMSPSRATTSIYCRTREVVGLAALHHAYRTLSPGEGLVGPFMGITGAKPGQSIVRRGLWHGPRWIAVQALLMRVTLIDCDGAALDPDVAACRIPRRSRGRRSAFSRACVWSDWKGNRGNFPHDFAFCTATCLSTSRRSSPC